MARILLLETATEVCATAVAVDGQIVAQQEAPEAVQHAALLTLQIAGCMRQAGFTLAGLDAVALSRGPGSYTSLRVGAAVAKGICYALDKPLIAVDTLLALALASRDATPAPVGPGDLLMPMLDARRQEVWTALYNTAGERLIPAQPLILENYLLENLVAPWVAGSPEVRVVFSGNGMDKLLNVSKFRTAVFSYVKKCKADYLAGLAEDIFQRGDFQEVAYFEPFYMKPPNITIPKSG